MIILNLFIAVIVEVLEYVKSSKEEHPADSKLLA